MSPKRHASLICLRALTPRNMRIWQHFFSAPFFRVFRRTNARTYTHTYTLARKIGVQTRINSGRVFGGGEDFQQMINFQPLSKRPTRSYFTSSQSPLFYFRRLKAGFKTQCADAFFGRYYFGFFFDFLFCFRVAEVSRCP